MFAGPGTYVSVNLTRRIKTVMSVALKWANFRRDRLGYIYFIYIYKKTGSKEWMVRWKRRGGNACDKIKYILLYKGTRNIIGVARDGEK